MQDRHLLVSVLDQTASHRTGLVELMCTSDGGLLLFLARSHSQTTTRSALARLLQWQRRFLLQYGQCCLHVHCTYVQCTCACERLPSLG